MKSNILQKTPIAALLALFCSALWGSAFPCVKIGYDLFGIDKASTPSIILFAGVRFFIAGIMVIIIGSIIRKKPLVPKPAEIPKVMLLSLFQTILQYLFFYIGLANTSGVKSSVIEGMSVFVCILVSALIFRLEKLTLAKMAGCILGTAGIIAINLDSSLLSNINFTGNIKGSVYINLSFNFVSRSTVNKSSSLNRNPFINNKCCSRVSFNYRVGSIHRAGKC